LDSSVLSTTPGNFFALKTVKTSLKQLARMGAFPVLMAGRPGRPPE
jgi:hypothetical protein